MTDSDDEFQLSAEAKKALDEFLAEQKQVESADVITENWQLSQFWYTDETSVKLAQECVKAAIACKSDNDHRPQIACVSCPSVMEKLVELPEFLDGLVGATVFEFDTRFETKYGQNFSFFDYNKQDQVDQRFLGSFDVVISDPPFLSQECQLKNAVFARRLLREPVKGKIILCTGTTMEEIAERAFGAKRTTFKPQHRNNLANDFACFTSYPPLVL